MEIALLGISVTSVASPVQTLAVENVYGAAATAKASAATKGGKNANRRDTLRWAKRIVDGESA